MKGELTYRAQVGTYEPIVFAPMQVPPEDPAVQRIVVAAEGGDLPCISLTVEFDKIPSKDAAMAVAKPEVRRILNRISFKYNLSISEPGIPEIERYKQGEAKAEKLLKDEGRSMTDSFYWPYKPSIANELEFGDWVIQTITYKDKTITVYPPGQLLLIDSYVRDAKSAKERYVFHLEVPRRGETMTWKQFRQGAKSILNPKELVSPRTRPVRDVQVADNLLGLWTARGRVSRR